MHSPIPHGQQEQAHPIFIAQKQNEWTRTKHERSGRLSMLFFCNASSIRLLSLTVLLCCLAVLEVGLEDTLLLGGIDGDDDGAR